MKAITIRIPDELKEKIDEYLKQREMTLTDLIRSFLRTEIEKYEKSYEKNIERIITENNPGAPKDELERLIEDIDEREKAEEELKYIKSTNKKGLVKSPFLRYN